MIHIQSDWHFLEQTLNEVGTVEINTFCSVAVWSKMLGYRATRISNLKCVGEVEK